jgi:drug/metabolite transporter (DMT)-like permease
MKFIGEIAAISTAFFFALTAIIFTRTGQMVGSQVTNRVRLLFGLGFLAILNLILYHEPLPFSAGSSRWVWLGLSGVIGLSLGDAFLFQSFVSVGARLGSLLLSINPIFGSIIAWVFFDEKLTALQITGIFLALAGVGWVLASHQEPADTPQGHTRWGVILGILGALCQAVGLVLAKQGMVGDFSAFQGNAIRMLIAAISIWALAVLQKQAGETLTAVRKQPQSLGLIALGSLCGPVLGVSGSLLAIQHAEIGVASTLMALMPVIVLPISYFVFKEKVGWQAIAGTLLAIAGVAVLFLA